MNYCKLIPKNYKWGRGGEINEGNKYVNYVMNMLKYQFF